MNLRFQNNWKYSIRNIALLYSFACNTFYDDAVLFLFNKDDNLFDVQTYLILLSLFLSRHNIRCAGRKWKKKVFIGHAFFSTRTK